MEFYVLVQETTVHAEDDTPCPGPTNILGTMVELPKEDEELIYTDKKWIYC